MKPELNTDLINRVISQKEMSVGDLAAYVDVERETICKWLSGYSFPKQKRFTKLCDVLEISRSDAVKVTEKKSLTVDAVKKRFFEESLKLMPKSNAKRMANRDKALITAIVESINECMG